MASSSDALSLTFQLPRYSSPARLGLSALNARPSPSARLQTRTRGLRCVAATLYQHEAAGHADSAGGVAATSALHLLAGDDAAAELIRAAARVRAGGAPRSPKGRPGAPREGSGGKVHAAPPTLLRLPKEGSGGQGGSIH